MFDFFAPKFKLAAGVVVSNLHGVKEGYSVQNTGQGYAQISVNISADRLEKIYLGLAALVNTPAFAIIEIPTHRDEEEKLRIKPDDPFHHDIYYLDGLSFNNYNPMFLSYS
jgi:hypothetical protein